MSTGADTRVRQGRPLVRERRARHEPGEQDQHHKPGRTFASSIAQCVLPSKRRPRQLVRIHPVPPKIRRIHMVHVSLNEGLRASLKGMVERCE